MSGTAGIIPCAPRFRDIAAWCPPSHGRLLATCGDDGAIQIWEMETGDPVTTLRRDRPYERLDITGIKGLTDAQKLALKLMGAVEDLSHLTSTRLP